MAKSHGLGSVAMSGRMPPPQAPPQAQQQPPMRLMAQHPHAQGHPHNHVVHQHQHPQSAADLPLSITSLMHVMRDAEHLTARYGSTTAACARLEELEHSHVDLQTQLSTMQQKLNMAMVAAAAAQVDGLSNGKSAERPTQLPAFSADALLSFLQYHCACRGNLALFHAVLQDFQRSLVLPPDTRFQPRDVLLSVHEISPVLQDQTPSIQERQGHSPRRVEAARKKKSPEVARLTPKLKLPGSGAATSSPARALSVATPPRAIAPATGMTLSGTSVGSASLQLKPKPKPPADRRAQREEKQHTKAAIVLSALARPTSANSNAGAVLPVKAPPKSTMVPARDSVEPKPSSRRTAVDSRVVSKKRASLRHQDDDAPSSNGEYADADEVSSQLSPANEDHEEGPVTKRKRSSVASSAPEAAGEIVVKQNLSLPYDKRNIVELKQSSQLLTLDALEALSRRGPWDEVYKLRSVFSHILNYQTLSEPARRWFISALRIQFVWRREFWERLHWLPMSDSICSGGDWEKYRQTRKRRANKAIAAWRKVYSDSLELMRKQLLPEDVWCDVSLWYMPSTPLYWLPSSSDLNRELDQVDAKHPVRCYYVKDVAKHPFYSDQELQRKYPSKHELPSPALLALQNEDKESRVNYTPE